MAVRAHHEVHKPGKAWKAARTLKSFVLSEAESFSREAKVEWAHANSHAAYSLQHDGVMILFRDGTDAEQARQQLQAASEAALGYAQANEYKAAELPDGAF